MFPILWISTKQSNNVGLRNITAHFCIFTLLCGASKGSLKTFKAFIKPFEAPRKSVKIKIHVNFLFQHSFLKAQDRKG